VSRARLSTPRLAVLAVVFLAVIAALAVPVRVYLSQRSQVGQLSAQQRREAAAVARLRAELHRWQSPAYVRAQATQRLQFLLPGETYYEVLGGIPGGSSPAGPRAASAGPVTAGAQPWYSALWGTVAQAGRRSPHRRAAR
jgi:cell division protein FtsB